MSDDNLYKLSNMKRLQELMDTAPEPVQAFLKFDEEVYADRGNFSLKVKEAIAVACAHVTGCPYCIETHVNRFRDAGGTKEELLEAILIAGSLRAGGALSHGVNALNAFYRGEGEQSGEETTNAATKPNGHGPQCLC